MGPIGSGSPVRLEISDPVYSGPYVTGQELDYLARRSWRSPETSGNGSVRRAGVKPSSRAELDGARVMMTPSCTHALELSALLLDIQPEGDEVIVPTFTFTSTANAYVLYGATAVSLRTSAKTR